MKPIAVWTNELQVHQQTHTITAIKCTVAEQLNLLKSPDPKESVSDS